MAADASPGATWEELQSLDEKASEAALVALWDANKDRMYSLGFCYLWNRSDAADAVQEAFCRFIRVVRRVKPKCSPKAYLLTILRNVCIDVLRKWCPTRLTAQDELPIESVASDSSDDPSVVAMDRDRWERLWRAVRSLSSDDRTAIIFKFVLRFSNQEAAEILQVRKNTFEVRVCRALRDLRQSLNGLEL